ncbi:hypothetical protein [Halodesulfovibrio sp. MK-HDV]|uniref:hypothetical protein n=1 Tax=unclassified Halodesulfovibrio TaxID=2644657 RepID=UPI00136F97E8|nr:hypothetical protein [Halodesulfovibrio sp. MK-HDV]
MNHITGTFTFPADEPALADHFPDSPVIPGTLIIHSFVSVLRERMPDAVLSVSKFRFKLFVTPDAYAYSIEPKPFGFACTLLKDGKKAVTGRILVQRDGEKDA